MSKKLLALGLVTAELAEEEFFCAEKYVQYYSRLSVYDCVTLAIAKCRGIALLTGDGPLRKAAKSENVPVVGTIGILDQLYDGGYIARAEYLECLRQLHRYNGGKVRLPEEKLRKRLEERQ